MKPQRRVPIQVDDANLPATARRPGSSGLAPDLKTAAAQTENLELKRLYGDLMVPHDTIVFNQGRIEIVKPLRDRYPAQSPEFRGQVEPLDNRTWEEQKPYAIVGVARLRSIESYEDKALRLVEKFLKSGLDALPKSNPNHLTRQAMLRAAEQVLTPVVRFHESARERGDRKGESWFEIDKALRRRLLDVQLEQLNALADGGDWNNAYSLGARLADAYSDPETRAALARPLTELARASIRQNNATEAQIRLRLLSELFPNTTVTRPLTDNLRKQAQDLLNEARSVGGKDRDKALALIKAAEQIDPRLPGLEDFRLQLINEYPILKVGMRHLPGKDNLSPARAFTDADQRAVDLVFESLIHTRYDARTGQRYVPGLAIGPPQVVPLGRQFELPRDAFWSNGRPLTAADVSHTVRLLKDRNWAGRVPAWADDLFEEVQVGGDPYQVNLTLRQGFLNPLALMTFKILPQEPTPGQGLLQAADLEFARNPVGSGPYRYEGIKKDTEGRNYFAFVANPYYSGRSDRVGLPRIREVHFYQFKDPTVELQKRKLDLVLDLNGKEVKKAQDTVGSLVVPPPQPTRRVYFLAVNHRQAQLQDKNVRLALAHAIHREALLNENFRAVPGEKVHRPLNGPYPAGSWACDPELAPDLFDPDRARAFMKLLKDRPELLRFTLKYPEGDPVLEKAMVALCEQIEKTIGVKITPLPLSPHALHRDVEEAHDYQLAYYYHDFPNDAFWLWPMFDPRATEAGGGNYLGYRNDAELELLLRELTNHRDFSKVREKTHLLHRYLYFKVMPLIPLWQLDSYLVHTPFLRPMALDPLAPFSDIDEWQLQIDRSVASRP